ncbi:MAG TPA: hypothetical protein VGI53_07020 [Dyella sp.]
MTRLPLNQNTIAILVDRFYEAVRANMEIGPVFNAAIENWSEHKQLRPRPLRACRGSTVGHPHRQRLISRAYRGQSTT